MLRHLSVAIACLVAMLLTATALAQDSQTLNAEPSPTLYQYLIDFNGANFRGKAAIADDMAAAKINNLSVVLNYLLEGELYLDKSESKQFYRVTKVNGTDLIESLDGDELATIAVASIEKKSLRKVRTNNRLRKHLRLVIARITLQQGSDTERLAAAKSMLGQVDKDSAELLVELQSSEVSSDVRTIMDVALAIYQVKSGSDQQKLDAIDILEGRLEPEARGALAQALDRETQNKALQAALQKAYSASEDKVEFFEFLETLFFGLSLGSVFLLAAIGLAITFGVMGVINMAHGEMIMLGAYTTYVVQLLMPNHLEYSLLVAIPAAFIVSGLFGVAIEQGVIRFLHGRPLETLLATFGISLILQQLVRTVFSPLNRQVASPDWISGAVEINPVLSLTLNRLYILAFSLMVFAILMYVFKYTNLGLNVRAVSQNRAMAKAMGVRTQWVDAMTFGLGSGVAGVAGVALSQLTNVGPNLGQSYIIDSFMVVVFGGVGNLLGTLVGAFSLGIANKFLEPITGAVLANILVLVFIILFIQKRPKGLFPQKGRAAE